jgi:hypothetical protein
MKKVIFVATDFMQINYLILNEMRQLYDVSVVVYPFENSDFKYKNFGQKINNFFQKTFFNNKKFKSELVKLHIEDNLNKQLSLLDEDYDFTFILNIEYFSNQFLLELKKKSKKMIAYQWDGLSRTPEVYEKIEYCDSFFAFNPEDVDNDKIFLATNFFFDIPLSEKDKNESDLFYIGSYLEERFSLLEKLISKANELGLTSEILLFSYKKDIIKKNQNSNVVFINEFYSYKKNLEKVNNSKIIIDLKLEVHNGLSFRFFECLFIKKKMITNNKSIVNYDFYHPNNIFILTDSNLDSLEDFVKLPYVEIPEEIVMKYNFKNWIKKILENE